MEEEIKTLKEQIAKLEAEKTTLTTALAEKETALTAETEKVTTLTASIAEKDTKIEEFETKELVASRTEALTAAGITVDIKPERITKMDDQAFAEYVEDLKAVAKASAKTSTDNLALASARGPRIPRFDPSDAAEGTVVSPVALKEKLGRISRSQASAETE